MWLLEAAIKKGWRGEGEGGRKKRKKRFVSANSNSSKNSGEQPGPRSAFGGLCQAGTLHPVSSLGASGLGHKPIPVTWHPPRRQDKVFSKLKVFPEPAPLLLGHQTPTQGAVAWHRLPGTRRGRSRSCCLSARSYF